MSAARHGPRPRSPRWHGLVASVVVPLLLVTLAASSAGASTQPPTGPAAAPVASRAQTSGSAEPRHRVPLEGATLLARFRAPAHAWGPGHRGVDLAGTGPVRSPADGVVTFSGVVVDRGVLTVSHDDGLRSSFEPVVEGLPTGTEVRAGDPVADVARGPSAGGHCAPTGCLHWGVRRGEEYLDPLLLLGRADPVVLLPLG